MTTCKGFLFPILLHQLFQKEVKQLWSNFLQRACVDNLEFGGSLVQAVRAEVRGTFVGQNSNLEEIKACRFGTLSRPAESGRQECSPPESVEFSTHSRNGRSPVCHLLDDGWVTSTRAQADVYGTCDSCTSNTTSPSSSLHAGDPRAHEEGGCWTLGLIAFQSHVMHLYQGFSSVSPLSLMGSSQAVNKWVSDISSDRFMAQLPSRLRRPTVATAELAQT